jgi:3-hydroxyisobutyrate dehydrogenase-like beta-hydroxyacid dehydrogenase
MGLPLARRLTARGLAVSAFDVDEAARDRGRGAGVAIASDARALAAGVDVLVTVLPGPPELRSAMLGSDGVLDAMTAGSCWLDLTSNDPRVATEVARAAAARGVESVGAPMAGGPDDAEAGRLGFWVGGRPDAVSRVRPLLASLGDASRLTVMGDDVAAGYTTKLLANTLWFGQVVAGTEMLLVGQAMGLDEARLGSVLAAGPGGSAFLTGYLDRLLAGDDMPAFGIDRVVEELDTVTSLASEAGTPAELTAVVARLHRDALDRFGAVDGELLAARLLEARAGRTLRG